jgi:hypothetical protein
VYETLPPTRRATYGVPYSMRFWPIAAMCSPGTGVRRSETSKFTPSAYGPRVSPSCWPSRAKEW